MDLLKQLDLPGEDDVEVKLQKLTATNWCLILVQRLASARRILLGWLLKLVNGGSAQTNVFAHSYIGLSSLHHSFIHVVCPSFYLSASFYNDSRFLGKSYY